ncbi:unnamed protein product [Blumeria hordei]|uniref:Microbial-type PARG catalytic domain-containing protein n=2 Tax=Blumeria hordei TaxID=2867405 RepID=A0A383URB8_BLUHO|nr:hypothetical protein BGHDH14_bgh03093 [Blumeria hordei DH14]SZF02329.1 unnamed protein product [Blumeria hordei]
MPSSKPKASDVAADAKKTYIPHIKANYSAEWPATSYLCYSESMVASPPKIPLKCRFAFYERDPVDVALDWADPTDNHRIPVIMPANEKRPGGDWEASVMSPEECLCRRSNLYATLTTPASGNAEKSNYPIPGKAGIYSANVVVFRNGPDRYEQWPRYRSLPIISVCPVKRPKLDSSGKKYSFKQEKDLMREKIHAALRIAVWYKHTRLCIGTFGLGTGFRNPTEEVALLWRDALLNTPEFMGHFQDIVFAFEAADGPTNTTSAFAPRVGSSKSSKGVKTALSKSSVAADLAIFRHVFKPAVIHNAFN